MMMLSGPDTGCAGPKADTEGWGHRCMEGFVLETSQPYFEPES